ncbi:MAG TPA: hypothetical protein VF283_22995 [Bryobacteraceae bacterium]
MRELTQNKLDRSLIARRDFLRGTGFTAGALACASLAGARKRGSAALILDPNDSISSGAPVRWAAERVEAALRSAGFDVQRRSRPRANELSIVAAGPSSHLTASRLRRAGLSVPDAAESLALFEDGAGGDRIIVASGADARGLAYALCEVADRIRHGSSLQIEHPIAESPANPVRSVMRQFTSSLLDKPWFYNRDEWQRYLDLLASERWNRLDLAFGLGYDSLRRVDDSYFLFFYPFVVSVPGYNVRATNVSDDERDRNLATLQFISEQTVARGMDFELGIWMHGYQWGGGHAKNIIEGLTPETHARYCRDALTLVLQKCPAISAVGLRIHGESGVPEGNYGFWAAVFDGAKRCGRRVELDLHAKGIDAKMIDTALATGLPVNLSAKFSAEHLGMPYQQTAIREMEMPVAGRMGKGLMKLSEGSRIFTRYSYADLLRENRKYTIRYRVFSGTQKILLWDDPVSSAAYSRAFQFCGSAGADVMEPLTCRGRRGSAVAGRRDGYVEASLETRWGWQKYAGWYRTLGRLMYNPKTDPAVCLRAFSAEARPAALQGAIASASRILPIVTTAYLPSAACDAYWPEIYWNQPLAAEPDPNPYGDTLKPKVFQNASPLDPQLFSSMREFAEELLSGRRSGKYSHAEVADWLDNWSDKSLKSLRSAGRLRSAASKRLAIDVRMQAALGLFFAAKFRAGILYAIYEQTQDRRALHQTIKQYRRARASWAQAVRTSKGVYARDLSVSDRFDERGQWADRLAGIDADIADLGKKSANSRDPRAPAAIAQVLQPVRRDPPPCRHTAPASFRPNEALRIHLGAAPGSEFSSIHLLFRHVNQAERYQKVQMRRQADGYSAEIPAVYTNSPYALQYYFELRSSAKRAWLYPGFAPDPINVPYFVVRQA